jgi:hypothetical protein
MYGTLYVGVIWLFVDHGGGVCWGYVVHWLGIFPSCGQEDAFPYTRKRAIDVVGFCSR